ncbi:MAG: ribbon-helix-helix protein, CopG family [Candidatus Caldarchaeum sp.]
MPQRQPTSIKIDPEVWKEAKKHAIDKGETVSELIERLLREELGKKKSQE